MGHAITFAQQKGGAGKTTLLVHVAQALTQKKQQVALLDLDPQGSLTTWATHADNDNLTLLETASYRIGGDIRSAKGRYDYVLVDCPGNASSILEAAIRDCDLVVLPCQPSQMDVWATKPVLAMCDAEKTPARVVLNRCPPRGTAADEAAAKLKDMGAVVLKSRVGNRIAYSKAFGQGATALDLTGQKPAKAEITKLAAEIARVVKSLG